MLKKQFLNHEDKDIIKQVKLLYKLSAMIFIVSLVYLIYIISRHANKLSS